MFSGGVKAEASQNNGKSDFQRSYADKLTSKDMGPQYFILECRVTFAFAPLHLFPVLVNPEVSKVVVQQYLHWN